MERYPLENYANDYIRLNRTYKKQVFEFIKYLKKPDVNRIIPIGTISDDDVDLFIGQCKQIGYYETMASYLEGIKSFDEYLYDNGIRKDYILPRGDAYGKLKMRLAEKYNLKEKVERVFLSSDEIKSIFKAFEKYFKETDYENLSERKKEQFIYRLCLKIYLKISLIAPAKKAVLFGLRFKDFDYSFRFFSINDVRVNIGDQLHGEIQDALKLLKRISNVDWRENDYFFNYFRVAVSTNKQKLESALNAIFRNFLVDYSIIDCPKSSSFPLDLVSNNTIYQYVVSEVNPWIISKVTGITIAQLESKYYSKFTSFDDDIVTQRINNANSLLGYDEYL